MFVCLCVSRLISFYVCMSEVFSVLCALLKVLTNGMFSCTFSYLIIFNLICNDDCNDACRCFVSFVLLCAAS